MAAMLSAVTPMDAAPTATEKTAVVRMVVAPTVAMVATMECAATAMETAPTVNAETATGAQAMAATSLAC